MSERDGLSALGRLVDNAMQLASQLNQKMTVHILSVASLEIARQIEAGIQQDDPDYDRKSS
jgi:hypothetical protein